MLLPVLSDIEALVAEADMLVVALMKVLMRVLMEALGTVDEPLAAANAELEVGGAILDICDDEE